MLCNTEKPKPEPRVEHRQRALEGPPRLPASHWASAALCGLLPALALAAAGCRKLPEAPTELSELSTWLFQHLEDPDPDVLAVGLGNLQAFFEDQGIDEDLGDQAWEIQPLTDEHVADVDHPDRDPSSALPVGLVATSSFEPAEHATVVILPDQTPVEPASPNLYERSFLDPTDPSCFPDQGCEILRTDNRIRKENFIMSIEYTKLKDYRWSDVLRAEGDPQRGFIARSWFEEEFQGDQEATAIHQSYSIDVVLPDSDGETLRYVALWTEATMYGAGDDIIQSTMRGGLEDMLEATEVWLGEQPR